jgi:hypothetical protein
MDNIESMSPEELKAALVAKDAMVLELEQKIKDMQAEVEASLSAEMPEMARCPRARKEKPAVIVVDGEKPDDEKKKASTRR